MKDEKGKSGKQKRKGQKEIGGWMCVTNTSTSNSKHDQRICITHSSNAFHFHNQLNIDACVRERKRGWWSCTRIKSQHWMRSTTQCPSNSIPISAASTFSDHRSLSVTIAIYFTSHSPSPKKRFHCFAFLFFIYFFFNLIPLLCEASLFLLCSINYSRPTLALAFETRSLVFRCVVNTVCGIW